MSKKMFLGTFIFVFVVAMGAVVAGAANFSQVDIELKEQKDADKDNKFYDLMEKTLASTIEGSYGISECEIEIDHSEQEELSVSIHIVTENSDTDTIEAEVQKFVSDALGISGEQITIIYN